MGTSSHTILIKAPLEQLFHPCENFANFPLLLNFVKEVELQTDGLLHWKIQVQHEVKEFVAEISDITLNKSIAWQSVDGTLNSGKLEFNPGPGITGIHVSIVSEFEFHHMWPTGPIDNPFGHH
jgi:uncharacterized membrane protein